MTTQGKDGRAALLEQAIRLKRASSRARDAELGKRPVESDALLGQTQRSLWLQHQLEPRSAAYHLASAYRVPEPPDLARLQSAFGRLIERHRILRSTFRVDGDRVLQVVGAGAGHRIKRLSARPGEGLSAAGEAAREPFELERGPLIRLLMVEEPDQNERLLVLVLHHILADERSLDRIWRELAESYDHTGTASPAVVEDEREPQFDDYVHWQAGREPEPRAEGLAFWRGRLDPSPETLRLPFESPASGQRPEGGRLIRRLLAPEIGERLRAAAAASETTPFAVLSFVFRLLLARYTEGRDIAFGTPVSTRSHPATADMVGYFLNPVAVRASIDESRPVVEAIRAFDAELRACLGHASVPFDRLVEELSPARPPGRHPLFQTMFVYQESPSAPKLAGRRLEPVTLDLGESKFDLTLFAFRRAGSVEVAVEYRADRFEEAWMRKLLGHFECLAGNLASDLAAPVAEVSMLAREEREELGAWARGPEATAAGRALLPQRILRRAREAPTSAALVCAGEAWSYAELERAGRAIARELSRAGAGPGARVGLFVERSPQMVAAVLGCHWAGAAYVPLDPAYPPERNRFVLEDAEVSAVLVSSETEDRLPSLRAPVIAVDRLAATGGESWEPTPVDADTVAYILYTSGSTGRPKGVVVTHGNLSASIEARRRFYDTPPGRFLLLPSVAFDSSVAGLFWTLSDGAELVLPTEDEARDPRQLAGLISRRRVTGLLCVPSLYRAMIARLDGPVPDLESVVVAGESCSRQLVDEHFAAVPGARLFNEYGPTEATVWATVEEVEPAATGEEVAIGRPIAGVRLEVRDALGRPVPAGVPGEGWIAGPTVAQGYWRRDDLTRERFVSTDRRGAEQEFRTGDRLSWSADGRLMFRGRVDGQIKLRGFRIEPGEIEALLTETSGVEEAAVVVREPDQLVAFVVGKGGVEGLRRQLARKLPDFMVPNRIVEVAELPRLPNGKVDRVRLRALPLDPEAPRLEAGRVLGDREQALVSLWEGLLGRSAVRTTDNFFQLGGHSLLVVAMTAAIEKDFGVALAPAEIFQNPTIEELSRRIEQEGGSGAPSYAHLFPIEPGGRKAPFVFSVPHFFSGMVAARFRGERPVYGLRGVSLRENGNRGRWPTMRDLGRELVEEVQRRFPEETVILAGYSFGASMAVEMARLLEERGTPARKLFLIAPMPLDFLHLGPFHLQLDGLRRPVGELSLGEALGRLARHRHPFARRAYQRAWRTVAIQPWRRILCLAGRLRALAGLPLTPGILHADVRLERFRLHAGYRPGTLRTPTVIFNAAEPETDAAATWRPHFEGPFEVREITDPHLGGRAIEAAKKSVLEGLGDLGD